MCAKFAEPVDSEDLPDRMWFKEASILNMKDAGTVMVSRVSSSMIWLRRTTCSNVKGQILFRCFLCACCWSTPRFFTFILSVTGCFVDGHFVDRCFIDRHLFDRTFGRQTFR